ncbi:MAG: hypothetical protein PHE89_03870 [Alphaproteobacteria bacterium]|nr:hypothetical protein [Alphaproteobacteria bacterium]
MKKEEQKQKSSKKKLWLIGLGILFLGNIAFNLFNQTEGSNKYGKEGFVARLTCGMNGKHLNIMPCLHNTMIEVRTNGKYFTLNSVEANQSSFSNSFGVDIPLTEHFAIQAQNGDNTFLLTLTVFDKATKDIVYQKSVPQYGVVSAWNK